MEQTSQRELRTVDPTWTLAELMAHLTHAIKASLRLMKKNAWKVAPERFDQTNNHTETSLSFVFNMINNDLCTSI